MTYTRVCTGSYRVRYATLGGVALSRPPQRACNALLAPYMTRFFDVHCHLQVRHDTSPVYLSSSLTGTSSGRPSEPLCRHPPARRCCGRRAMLCCQWHIRARLAVGGDSVRDTQQRRTLLAKLRPASVVRPRSLSHVGGSAGSDVAATSTGCSRRGRPAPVEQLQSVHSRPGSCSAHSASLGGETTAPLVSAWRWCRCSRVAMSRA